MTEWILDRLEIGCYHTKEDKEQRKAEDKRRRLCKNAGIELLSPGRELADGQGGRLCALIIGSDVQKAVTDTGRMGQV